MEKDLPWLQASCPAKGISKLRKENQILDHTSGIAVKWLVLLYFWAILPTPGADWFHMMLRDNTFPSPISGP